MKIAKSTTALLLIFVFAFTSLCSFAAPGGFSDVPETNYYYEAITSLVDEGIINGYEDGTFRPDNTITRAEFSKLLAAASAPSGYSFTATTTTFPDIADMQADHGWAVPYIAYAVSTKAINGYTDGTFRPGNNVTQGEAIKMIVCTLGYGPVVDTTLTPWYKGYIDVASQIGLTKGISVNGDTPANRGIVAGLIYNMLDCPVLTQTGTDGTGKPIYSTEGSGSLSESKDNAKAEEGILMGVTDYSLDGTAVGRNRIQIDDKVFVLGGKLDMDTMKSYLGYRVSYNYTGSGSKAEVTKVVRMTGYNEEITVEPWQIDTIDGDYIEYYADEAAEKKGTVTKISFSSPYVIYNGMPVDPSVVKSSFIKEYFDIEMGSLKFFSNDGNSKTAELVTVESYKTYFVNSPATSNGVTTIYDKNQSYTKLDPISLDEEDIESITKVSSKGGKPTNSALTAIAAKNVVSVAMPYGAEVVDGKISSLEGTSVIISSAYVTGDVNELSSDYENIVIGTANYELSPYYERLVEAGCPDITFSNGDNAKFYLDHLGRIVFVEKNDTSDPYGLLVAYAKGNSMDAANALKIMTTGGKYLEYNMKSTIRINGESMDSEEAIEELKKTCPNYADIEAQFKAENPDKDCNIIIQPVKYRTSGTQFTAIETLAPSVAKSSLKYSTSGYAFKDGSATKFSMVTSGTKATVTFVIPSDITAYDKYKKSSAGYFSNNATYDVEAYEVENSSARVVLAYLKAGQTAGVRVVPGTPVYLVESINDARNDAGQTVKKLRYRNLAKTEDIKEILSSDDNEIISALESVNSGDLIKFVTENNEIVDVKTVYVNGELTDETGKRSMDGHYILKDGNNTGDKYYQVVLGTIYNQDDDSKQFSVIPDFYEKGVTSSAEFEESHMVFTPGSSIAYYEYDSKNAEFKQSASGSIKKYVDFKDSDPELATKAVVLIVQEKVVGVYLLGE